jgi:hypothetical protein
VLGIVLSVLASSFIGSLVWLNSVIFPSLEERFPGVNDFNFWTAMLACIVPVFIPTVLVGIMLTWDSKQSRIAIQS